MGWAYAGGWNRCLLSFLTNILIKMKASAGGHKYYSNKRFVKGADSLFMHTETNSPNKKTLHKHFIKVK